MDKKNILELCLSPDLGGLELFMISCYEHFKNYTNCKIIIQKNSKLDQNIKDSAFYIKRYRLFPFISAYKLAKYIDRHDIDIVHLHWTKDILIAVLAKLISQKKPKLIQTRNMHMTRFKSDFYHRWLYKNIDIIHAVTNQVKNQLKKFIPKDISPKLEMVYMGVKNKSLNKGTVDKLRSRYNIKDSFVVGIIGRIEDQKGQYLVIEALNKLKELNMTVLIVGHSMDKIYMDQLEQKVKDYKLKDRVIFTGFTKDVYEHIKLCSCTILATPKETFGLVIVESMINRVPVIAVANGGPLEIIENGVDGLLFNRDSKDLANKIEYLYSNSEITNNVANNGYKKVVNMFNANIQLDKLYGVLNES
jgi:glycosyltransferase involved in cell wall biosynthesis